ncbi:MULTISPECIES: sel1 repeat family protein [unclassified Alteromonas]|uniref:sel1 repeat family protein n=1 Tax=unclassified Alteromonas TaxID=2614992 RepID=UPI0005098C13|nr:MULTISPECIES: sel1 repeat family protein [unclassified Alteromonas]
MRGLFLAVFALLIVVGDTGRYAPQLVANATNALSYVREQAASHVEPSAQSQDQAQLQKQPQAQLKLPSELTAENTYRVRAAFALLWHAAQLNSDEAQQTLMTSIEEITSNQLKPESNFPSPPGESDDSDELSQQRVNEQTAVTPSAQVSKLDPIYWLENLVSLDNADAAWLLYQLIGEESASERFMALAAKGNVAEAQLAYAMSSQSPKKREKWLIRAAEQEYLPAQAALADWYLLHDQNKKAKPLLAATASLDMQSAFKYGRLLWDEGNIDEAKIYLTKAANLGQQQAKDALAITQRYSVTALGDVKPFDWAGGNQCLQRIQPFAASLATMIRADSFYRQFNDDERLASLSLCVAPPIWLPKDALSCSDDYNNRNVLGCDVKPLANIAKKRQFSHAVVVAKQGKANVQNGVMFLDIGDTYSVFVHELAHFAGFADEYPIARSMARKICDIQRISDFSPPNLVIDSPHYYAPVDTVSRWAKIDPNTIVAKAKTCEGVSKNSYKPSRRITFMEHHDTGAVPPLYLVLWQQQLEKQQAQRPISMNFFQAFHHQGDQKEAAHWLAKYEAFVGKTS